MGGRATSNAMDEPFPPRRCRGSSLEDFSAWSFLFPTTITTTTTGTTGPTCATPAPPAPTTKVCREDHPLQVEVMSVCFCCWEAQPVRPFWVRKLLARSHRGGRAERSYIRLHLG